MPSIGGRFQQVVPPGPRDQRPLLTRSDVLVYTTPPLENDVEVTGPIAVTLYAASSATDTDFTAKLDDVYPDGTSMLISYGIQRARYRESQARQSLIKPGQTYKYHDSGMADEQPVQGRPPDPGRDLEQQLPDVRSQSEHGSPVRSGFRAEDRRPDDLPRQGSPVDDHVAHRRGAPSVEEFTRFECEFDEAASSPFREAPLRSIRKGGRKRRPGCLCFHRSDFHTARNPNPNGLIVVSKAGILGISIRCDTRRPDRDVPRIPEVRRRTAR